MKEKDEEQEKILSQKSEESSAEHNSEDNMEKNISVKNEE